MPVNNKGNYSRWQGPQRCQNDRDADINILATRMDDELNDMADGINAMLPADGRKTFTGSLNMGGNRVQNVGQAGAAADAPTAGQVQRFVFNYGVDSSAQANSIIVNLTPAMTALPSAGFVFVKVANANTGQTTLKINTLEEKPVLLGDQEISEGVLKAGQVYPFFYNNVLDAWQLIPSGATAGTAVPPFTLIMLDHLLSGEDAQGWELQGARCYKNKYWEAYNQLVKEYAAAVSRTETVEGQSFTYKLNLTTMRRFYSKADYDARFTLCKDSGGYVLDEETYSFYLPKSDCYFRPAVNAENIGQYQTDTMRPITGTIKGQSGQASSGTNGAFFIDSTYGRNGGLEDWAPYADIGLNSGRLGAHFNGTETAPKSRFVAVYYRLGTAYTEQISAAVCAAENAAKESAANAQGMQTYVNACAASSTQAKNAAEEAEQAAQQAEAAAAVAGRQTQVDWEETNPASAAYIRNKPDLKPRVRVEDTESTVITLPTAAANTDYHFGTLEELSIQACAVSDLETTIYFTAGASISVTLPESLKSIGKWSFAPGKTYAMSILNNILVVGELN